MILFICARRMGKIMSFVAICGSYGQLKFENDPLPDSVGVAGKRKILQYSYRKQLIALQKKSKGTTVLY